MTVTLSPETQQLLTDRMTGGYESADAAIRDALEVASAVAPAVDASDPDVLARAIAVGIGQADRGELHTWNATELRREIEWRFAAEQNPAGRGA